MVPVYVGNEPMPEAVTRYFLDHYVTVCERFNFSTAESDYEECGAFQHAAAQPSLVCRSGNKTNPALAVEPLQGRHDHPRAGDLGELLHARRSGVPISRRCATSRASARRAAPRKPSYWIASIRYTYAAALHGSAGHGAGIRSDSRSSISRGAGSGRPADPGTQRRTVGTGARPARGGAS